MTATTGPLGVSVGQLSFRNPIILPSGTAGYGHELEGVIDLDRLGGFVTKAVSVLPRAGAPSPRVAEFSGGNGLCGFWSGLQYGFGPPW